MANGSLSQMLIGQAAGEATSGQGVLNSQKQAVATGVQLATLSDQVESQKLKVQAQREKIETQKFLTMMNVTDKIFKSNPKVQKSLIKLLDDKGQALGFGPLPEATKQQLTDPENARAFGKTAQALFGTNVAGNKEVRDDVLGNLYNEFGFQEGLKVLSDKAVQGSKLQAQQQKETRAETREETRLTQQTFKNIQGLRKEFQGDPVTKDTKAIQQSLGKVTKGAESKNAAGDLALLFNFMKMLDPGSVVRESEFRTGEATAGVPERILQFRKKILEGERLTPNQRARFVDQAKGIVESQLEQQADVNARFEGIAERSDLPIKDLGITAQFRPAEKKQEQVAQQAPAAETAQADPVGVAVNALKNIDPAQAEAALNASQSLNESQKNQIRQELGLSVVEQNQTPAGEAGLLSEEQ